MEPSRPPLHKVLTRYLQQPADGLTTKRWFSGDDADLFYWQRPDGTLAAFQFTFRAGPSRIEYALGWRAGEAPVWGTVTERDPIRPPRTPLITPVSQPPAEAVAAARARFAEAAGQLPEPLRAALGEALGKDGRQ